MLQLKLQRLAVDVDDVQETVPFAALWADMFDGVMEYDYHEFVKHSQKEKKEK